MTMSPALRRAVAEANRRFWNIDADWATEVLVTAGATEALADCFFGLLEPPHLQAAVAFGLGLEDSYFHGLQATLQHNRDQLADGLRKLGFSALDCGVTYFLCVEIGGLDRDGDGFPFCRRLVAESGVAAAPVSSVYAERDMTSLIRLCSAKRLPSLHEALERLADWRNRERRTERLLNKSYK